jgi:paraquat-inducible protein B
MADQSAVVKPARRISAIWTVPIIALLIGIYMIVYNIMTQGPTIAIHFDTAEGIEAGKTLVRTRSVVLGQVEDVVLNEDQSGVVIHCLLDAEARALLGDDTQFWVVKPRFGAGGVSGLGTLLSGAYIELAPGSKSSTQREFVGLSRPPVTPASAAGTHVTITSDQMGSLREGNPVLFRGHTVGRIESAEFKPEAKQAVLNAFIHTPFDTLLNSNSRFFDSSGISFSATAEGLNVETASLESILSGGIAFETPDNQSPGGVVEPGTKFTLYPSRPSIEFNPFAHYRDYVVLFETSVRGLLPDAPVEYRGVRAGTVQRIMVEELVMEIDEDAATLPIPVLIRLEHGRLRKNLRAEDVDEIAQDFQDHIRTGMRASLASASLISGALYISLDFYPDDDDKSVGEFAGYVTIPSVKSGFAQIERQLSQTLQKINDLPLERTVKTANRTLRQLDKTLASADRALESVDTILADDATQELPEALTNALNEVSTALASLSPDSELHNKLGRTLNDLDNTLQSVEKLTRTLDSKPNSMVFSGARGNDPEPEVAD